MSPGAPASVHTLIVVDNPDAPGLRELAGAITDYTPNHVVRVTVMPRNEGASEARNAGMAQSFGDWTVLVSGGGRVPMCGCGALPAAIVRVTNLTTHPPRHPNKLDDDVIPHPSILDAYLGATLRFPRARVLVGLTELPPPRTLMEEALVICRDRRSARLQSRCQ